MKVILEGALICITVLVYGAFCNGDTTMDELPIGVASELFSMITQKALQVTGGCEYENHSISEDVRLSLYTRDKPSNPVILNVTNPSEVDVAKKTVLLIHGWISGANAYGIPKLKDAYLERYDCNIILVDWSKLAWKPYTMSVCILPKIAQLVADFLCHLDKQLHIPASSVHLVGHSLGGQMSGLIGQDIVNRCGKQLGRITALDPAGPFYQNLPESQRLDSSDAELVDVIHTNEGALGYWGNCGDIDFHVNCGVIQLGCPEANFNYNVEEIRKMPLEMVACHHLRSLDYMAESIVSDRFKARGCEECPLLCIPKFLRNTEIVMGEDCPANSPGGGYVLATSFQSPYGLGTLNVLTSLANIF